MVMTVKLALKVDRVGLFVLSEDKRSMVLKISERSKGVRLPVRGLAGAVLMVRRTLSSSSSFPNPFLSRVTRLLIFRTLIKTADSMPLWTDGRDIGRGSLEFNHRLV